MSERYQISTGRNVRAAYQRFVFSHGMQRGMLRVAHLLDGLALRLRAARLARDWAVRKLR
jgi:hypothetical protein